MSSQKTPFFSEEAPYWSSHALINLCQPCRGQFANKRIEENVVISHKRSQCKKIGINACNLTSIMLRDREYHYKLVLNLGSMVSKKWLYLSLRMEQNYLSHGPSTGPKQNGILCPLKVVIRISSCHICRIPTQGALILNHLPEARTTERKLVAYS